MICTAPDFEGSELYRYAYTKTMVRYMNEISVGSELCKKHIYPNVLSNNHTDTKGSELYKIRIYQNYG